MSYCRGQVYITKTWNNGFKRMEWNCYSNEEHWLTETFTSLEELLDHVLWHKVRLREEIGKLTKAEKRIRAEMENGDEQEVI